MSIVGDSMLLLPPLLALFGLVVSFFGRRLLRFSLAVTGFVLGAYLIAHVPEVRILLNLDTARNAPMAELALGIVGAGVALAAYSSAAPFLGAIAGTSVALLATGGSAEPFVLLVVGAGSGAVASLIRHLGTILATSIVGAVPVAAYIGMAFDASPQWSRAQLFGLGWTLPLWAVAGVALAGIVVQYRQYRQTATIGAKAHSSASAVTRPTTIDAGGADDASDAFSSTSVSRGQPRSPRPDGRRSAMDAEQRRRQVELDEKEAERRVAAARSAKRREVDDWFNERVTELRTEVRSATDAAGLALAPWTSPAWRDLDPDAPGRDKADVEPIRLGTVRLAAGEGRDDALHVPAAVAPAHAGGIVVTIGAGDPAQARAALLGWCARLLAVSAPGSVAVAWFDDGEHTEHEALVPASWRERAAMHDDFASHYRDELWRRLQRRSEMGATEHDARAHRHVVVAIGSAIEAVTDLERLLADYASAGAAVGLHLLAAARDRLDLDPHRSDVVQLWREHDEERFVVTDAGGERLPVRLQEAPRGDLMRRVAARSAPTPSLGEVGADANGGDATGATWAVGDDVDDEATGDGGMPPLPSFDETDAATPKPEKARTRESSTERLRTLLAAPSSPTPSVTLGVDAQGEAVRSVLDRPLLLCGGSIDDGAARLASYLLEAACQTDGDSIEFSVLDLSDHTDVAERFDAVVDLLPHSVDVAQGAQVYVTLEAALERLADGAHDGPLWCIFVVGSEPASERLPPQLERVMREGPAAGIVVCAWCAAPSAHVGVHDATGVSVEDDAAVVRFGDARDRHTRLDPPPSASEIEGMAAALFKARGSHL